MQMETPDGKGASRVREERPAAWLGAATRLAVPESPPMALIGVMGDESPSGSPVQAAVVRRLGDFVAGAEEKLPLEELAACHDAGLHGIVRARPLLAVDEAGNVTRCAPVDAPAQPGIEPPRDAAPGE
jgi:hypothetical protein